MAKKHPSLDDVLGRFGDALARRPLWDAARWNHAVYDETTEAVFHRFNEEFRNARRTPRRDDYVLRDSHGELRSSVTKPVALLYCGINRSLLDRYIRHGIIATEGKLKGHLRVNVQHLLELYPPEK